MKMKIKLILTIINKKMAQQTPAYCHVPRIA